MSKRRKLRKLRKKSRGYHAPSGYNRHHRKPKSLGGRNNPENISIVQKRHHQMFNELFGSNPTAHEVAQILTDVWIDPKYRIVVVLKDQPPEFDGTGLS